LISLQNQERAVDRNQKTQAVEFLGGVFADAGVVVVAHYSGLNVAQMSDLRNQMAEVGASFKVSKNRLAKLALAGTKVSEVSDLFTGPTAIAYSDDPDCSAESGRKVCQGP
jgi:large subunit ribosomal protein L10